MSAANTSTNTTSQCGNAFLDSMTIKVFKTFAYSTLLLFSLVGNALVLAVIYRTPKLRTIINFFICNMSISDIVMEIFVIPNRIKDVFIPDGLSLVDGQLGSALCKGVPFLHTTSVLVSIATLVTVAVERFYGIVYPMKKQPIGSKKACFVAIGFTWFLATVFATPNLYTVRLVTKQAQPHCDYSWEPVADTLEAYQVELSTFFVLFTILPFVILCSLYSAIIISLHCQKAQRSLAPEARARRTRENRCVTFMLLAVVIAFLLSWTPLNTYTFITAFVKRDILPCNLKHLLFAANFLSYMYPAINPFIYYIFNNHYKKGFHALLCRCWPCKRERQELDSETYNLRQTCTLHLSSSLQSTTAL